MKLNRTQALFLVGTIAAVGCVVDNVDDGGSDDENQAGAGGSSGSSGSGGAAGSGAKGGTSGAAGTYTGGTSTGGGGGEGGAICIGDGSQPQVSCDGFMEPGAGGMGSGGDGYGGAGGVGESCDGMAELQTTLCDDLWDDFKPGVANDARTCMKAQAPEDLCTWDFTFGCAAEAIFAACPDESADDECETITTDCPGMEAADCSAVLSGMTQAGRDKVVACEFCDLLYCAGVAP